MFETAIVETIALPERVKADAGSVVAAAACVAQSLREGHKRLLFGNGGSAGDAQHLAAEFVGRFRRERPALPALALAADSNVLTAIANDDGYTRVFARQIEALGESGDVALAITTSGRSANVVAGLAAAQRQRLRTIALTGGDGGPAGQLASIHVNVPSQSVARVQEVHRTWLHVLCEMVEDALYTS